MPIQVTSPEAVKALKEDVGQLGFSNLDEIAKTGRSFHGTYYPKGTYIFQQTIDKNNYTFLLCPDLNRTNGYSLRAIVAKALEYQSAFDDVSAAFDRNYLPIPHKYYIDEKLRRMRGIQKETEILLADKVLIKDFKKLGFDIKDPSMVHMGTNGQFASFLFLENTAVKDGLPQYIEYNFLVGPTDKKGEILPALRKDDYQRHIIAIQIGLYKTMDLTVNGPSKVFTKTYGINKAPFPSRQRLKDEIFQEKARIDEAVKIADKTKLSFKRGQSPKRKIN